MKIRIDRKMYAEAQRIADAMDKTFSNFVACAVFNYHDKPYMPEQELKPLTRSNSVSASVQLLHLFSVKPQRIRECIAIAIEKQRAIESTWPWRYDRSSLDAVVQLETFLGRSCNYHTAQEYIDRRVAERKAEIAAESKHTKKGRK